MCAIVLCQPKAHAQVQCEKSLILRGADFCRVTFINYQLPTGHTHTRQAEAANAQYKLHNGKLKNLHNGNSQTECSI